MAAQVSTATAKSDGRKRRWHQHKVERRNELIDYLTMLSWSALCGIVEVGGSLEKFRGQPHPSPIVPPLAD